MRDRCLWTFIIAALILWLPAFIAVWSTDPLVLHVALNRYHAPWADKLFIFSTWLANGLLAAVLAVLLLWKNRRSFLLMALATCVSGMMVQLIKHLEFPGRMRPVMFLKYMPGLNLVPGVELHKWFSFPSGHSTCAFSMCLVLAVLVNRRWASVLLAVLAATMAFSRVYLSQHFMVDVLAGAVLGMAFGIGAYVLLYKGPLGRKPGLDRSPFRKVGPNYGTGTNKPRHSDFKAPR